MNATNHTAADQSAWIKGTAYRACDAEPEKVEAMLSFEGRDHYVAFVAGWKAVLAESVVEVRAAKRDRALKGEENEHARAVAHERRESLRAFARGLFSLRRAGKVHARRAREARREAA